jgi:hypothetical protein
MPFFTDELPQVIYHVACFVGCLVLSYKLELLIILNCAVVAWAWADVGICSGSGWLVAPARCQPYSLVHLWQAT